MRSPQKGDAERTRGHIRKHLLSPHLEGATLEAFLYGAQHSAIDFAFDWVVGLEFLWDLARHGLIAVTVGSRSATGETPHAVLTERGRRVLKEESASIYDSTRYMEQLRKVVPEADRHRSSVVMLGCASERLVVLLAEAAIAAEVLPFAERLSKMLRPPKPAGIADIFDQVRKAVEAAAEDGKLGGLADGIDRKLTPIFEHTRVLRNRSGHPTGDEVGALEAEAGLLLFPGYYAFACGLIAKLGERAPSGGP